MATVAKEIVLTASAEAVWQAVRDFQAVHTRLVPGFVTQVQAEPGARVVTFANGTAARELLVSCDDAARRLVYSARSERLVHHNASVTVLAQPGGGSRILWVTDVLPDAFAGYIDGQMQAAAGIMQRTLEESAGKGAKGAQVARGT